MRATFRGRVVSHGCHRGIVASQSPSLHQCKEFIVKIQQAQRVVARDIIWSSDMEQAYSGRRETAEVHADTNVYADSLDIPLNQGGMMDAVRDAVRANF